MKEGSVSGEKKKKKKNRRRRRCENEEKKGEMEVKGRMRGQRKKQKVREMMMNPKKNKGSSGSGSGGFHGCYLLTSLSSRYKGHTYIGYTVNPKRRIRQHNGEICSGASSTKKKRPWELLLCIHGFPSSTCALQFEWAWQHPKESIAVREAAASFKTMGGVANKIKLALTMLTLPPWLPLDLTVSFFSTKYMNHTAGASPLLNLHFCSIDDLPCYSLSPLLTNINHDANVHIPPQPQPHYYHLDIDDDDSDEIHPHSPPIATHPFTQSHQTTLSHHSQLTLKGHYTQLSTLSMDQQLPQDDDMICVMMDDNIKGNTQHTHHHPPSTLSLASPIPPPKHNTPLIDLLTPSPHTRIIRGTKKQRPPSTSPDIIDLTRSPLFVQL